MQSIEFNSTWYKFDPIACYWGASQSEIDRMKAYMSTHFTNILNPYNEAMTWLEYNRFGEHVTFKTKDSFRVAFEKAINDAVARRAAAMGAGPPPPYTAAASPHMEAQKLFTATQHFDAYFDGEDSLLSPAYFRLFVSTPLFKGPGRYDFICSNRKIVSAAIDKRPSNDVFFHITAKYSGKGISVGGGSTAAGAPLVQCTVSGVGHDNWRVEPVGGDHFLLATYHSVQTLNVPDNSTEDGRQLVQWMWGGGANNEVWRMVPVGDGYYHIVSKHNGKLVGVKDASTADGAPIVQMPDTNANHHKWMLTPI